MQSFPSPYGVNLLFVHISHTLINMDTFLKIIIEQARSYYGDGFATDIDEDVHAKLDNISLSTSNTVIKYIND